METKAQLDLKYNDDGVISEVELDELYAALNTPITRQIQEPPSEHLSPDFLQNLKSRLKNTQKALLPLPPPQLIERNTLLRDMTDLIRLHATNNNPTSALEAFKELCLLNTTPTLHSINALLLAYKNANTLIPAITLFNAINQEFALTPNITSYTLLTELLAQQGNYIQTTRLIQNMTKNGLTPTEPIYHNLIKSALNGNKYKRVWEIYTHYKKEIGIPSMEMYITLINYCGQTGEAEKALEILEEILGKGYVLDGRVYSAIIKTLGMCDGYTLDAFSILEMIKKDGSNIGRDVYLSVMGCCELEGDIVKMRMYWNCICELDGDLKPDIEMVCIALRVYAKFIRKHYIFSNTSDPTVSLKESKNVDTTLKYGFGDSNGYSHSLLLEQVEQIWGYVENPTSTLLDAYLKVYSASNITFDKALKIYNESYSDTSPKTGETFKYILRHAAKIPKLMKTHGERIWADFIKWDQKLESEFLLKNEIYQPIMPLLSESSVDVSVEKADVDEINEATKMNPDYFLVSKQGGTLSEIEKEEIREKQLRNRFLIRDLFIRIANGYQRLSKSYILLIFSIGDIENAVSMIEQSTQFRSESYLPKIHFKDLQKLLTSVVNIAEDEGDFELFKRLFKVCPPEFGDPVDALNSILKGKEGAIGNIGRGWWGWECLGIGKLKRESLLNSFREDEVKTQRVLKRREGLKVKRLNKLVR